MNKRGKDITINTPFTELFVIVLVFLVALASMASLVIDALQNEWTWTLWLAAALACIIVLLNWGKFRKFLKLNKYINEDEQ